MKLNRLHIARHLLLRDLDLRFDRPGRLDTGQYALDFLVGVNGSGKSTVLRALTQIFLDLQADRTTDFEYQIEYILQSLEQGGPYQIAIQQRRESDGRSTKRMRVWPLGATDQTPIYDENAIDQNYLPKSVVIHTSGREVEWLHMLTKANDTVIDQTASEALLTGPVQRNIVELPGHLPQVSTAIEKAEEESLSLLIKSDRLSTVTLCGLIAHLATSSKPEKRPLNEVLDSIGLHFVRGFSLRFRLHKRLSPFETFEQLQPLATRHIKQGNDHLLVFDLSIDDYDIPVKLIETFGDILELYKALDALQTPSMSGEPTLQQVNLFLERETHSQEDEDSEDGQTVPKLFLLDWLSDGEQSFLGRMALLAMLDTEDSVILLDEPEVHFNDYWKREVVNLLDKIMQEHSNHLLITSHSSIVLSDVSDAQVTLLIKGSDGWAQQQILRIPLFAVDPSEIMVNYFGTERSVGQRSTRILKDAVERGEIEELESLLKIVGPGFWRYRIEDRLEELGVTPD